MTALLDKSSKSEAFLAGEDAVHPSLFVRAGGVQGRECLGEGPDPFTSPSHRATEFKGKLKQAEITDTNGLTLHSYRYAWAERAKTAGYPERFAMITLGHGRKAIARAYAKKAQVKLPSLEEYNTTRQSF